MARAAKLSRPVRDRTTGKTVATYDEAKRLVLGKLETRPGYQSWIHAAQLLTQNAAPEIVTTQIEYALLLDGALDVKTARL